MSDTKLLNGFSSRLLRIFSNLNLANKSGVHEVGLSLDQVIRAENHLFRNPSNCFERSKLIQHFASLQNVSKDAKENFEFHCLYLIEHYPLSEYIKCVSLDRNRNEAAFDRARDFWLKHLSSDRNNVSLLESISLYYSDKELGVCGLALKRLNELEPENSLRVCELVRFYRYMAKRSDPESARTYYTNAFGELSKSIQKVSYSDCIALLKLMLEVSYEANQFDACSKYAKLLVSHSDSLPERLRADGLNCGYLWLARISFESGRMYALRKYYLESARYRAIVPGSLLGPDLKLANKLLEAGHYKIVFEYLECCSTTWKENILKDLVEEFAAGQLPELKPYML